MPRSLRTVIALGLTIVVLTVVVASHDGGKADPPPRDKLAVVKAGTAWKGNLHTHSLWSDGDDFPEMIADWYKRHGYHFLTLSDHNILSDGERIPTSAGASRPRTC